MGREPIRLVVLLQDLEFGGTQRYAVHLLNRLDRDRFAPELWVLRGGDEMAPLLSASGVPIVWLSKSSWVGPRALFNLGRMLLTRQPQILYTLTVVPNIWGRLFGALARVPVIVSSYRNAIAKQHEQWLWRLSNGIICNAMAMKQILVHQYSVNPDIVTVIPNAVDTDYFIPEIDRKDARPTILYAGRLVEQKNPFDLLRAMKLVVEHVPDAHMLIVGDGHLREELQQWVSANDMEKYVEIHNGTRDVRSFMRRAWLFALASHFEGSPNVILEAMAVGLPVVATRVDGVPEIVLHGDTGLLVDPGNPKALADAFITMLQDNSLRNAMGKHARERVIANHSLDGMVRVTERALLEAMGKYTGAT